MRANQAAVQAQMSDEQIACENVVRMEVLLDLFHRGVITRVIKRALNCKSDPHGIVSGAMRDLFQEARFQVGLETEPQDPERFSNLYEDAISCSVRLRRANLDFNEPANLKQRSKTSRRIKAGFQPLRVLDAVFDPMQTYENADSVSPMRAVNPMLAEQYYNSVCFTNSQRRELIDKLHWLISALRYVLCDYDPLIRHEGAFLELCKLLAPQVELYWHDLITVDRHTVRMVIAGHSAPVLFSDRDNGCGTLSEVLRPRRGLDLIDHFKRSSVLVVVGQKGVRQTRLTDVYHTARRLADPNGPGRNLWDTD